MFAGVRVRRDLVAYPVRWSIAGVVAVWRLEQLSFHASTGMPVWPSQVSRIVEVVVVVELEESMALKAGPPDP